MSKYTDQANELYSSGCNCAQSAFIPFCKAAGMAEDKAILIASSFGGGIGGMRETCGALTGTFMAAGLLGGYGMGVEPEEKDAYNEGLQKLAEEFQGQFGSIKCGDLLECNEQDGSAETEEKPCMKYVLAAVENLEKTL